VIEVLITGESGFVGQNLPRYLENTSLHTLSRYLKLVLKPDLVETDFIIHLAGKAHNSKSVSQPDLWKISPVLIKYLA
jgi:nucleoside-diphosphate-sugar epimerase